VNTAGCINPQTFFIITKARQEKYCRRLPLSCVYLSSYTSEHTAATLRKRDIAALIFLQILVRLQMKKENFPQLVWQGNFIGPDPCYLS
jgi:hypothetical protein